MSPDTEQLLIAYIEEQRKQKLGDALVHLFSELADLKASVSARFDEHEQKENGRYTAHEQRDDERFEKLGIRLWSVERGASSTNGSSGHHHSDPPEKLDRWKSKSGSQIIFDADKMDEFIREFENKRQLTEDAGVWRSIKGYVRSNALAILSAGLKVGAGMAVVYAWHLWTAHH